MSGRNALKILLSESTPGPQGLQGPQGFTGTQGLQGPQGFTGPQGLQGPQGFTGTQGFTGPQGLQGPQGFTGTQGLQGPQGFTGFTGTQGLQGPQGFTGFTGTQGPTGTFNNTNTTLNGSITMSVSPSTYTGTGASDPNTTTILPGGYYLYKVQSPSNVDNTGIKINTSDVVLGRVIVISNISDYTPTTNNKKVKVYPPIGGRIDQGTATTGAQDVGANKSGMFICTDGATGASRWTVIGV